jgi:hypothetical protein
VTLLLPCESSWNRSNEAKELFPLAPAVAPPALGVPFGREAAAEEEEDGVAKGSGSLKGSKDCEREAGRDVGRISTEFVFAITTPGELP